MYFNIGVYDNLEAAAPIRTRMRRKRIRKWIFRTLYRIQKRAAAGERSGQIVYMGGI